ncbi:hypothetical protein GKZ89_14695 [Bacillus mangrovi]|uniref:Uncharacterized protein n=1 Tax=Metabacillus mangrovi TaxID=1491830 RepID=A0A7X2S714_9BACI|nr:YfmQ family protein [Metabacillus mangrovi]MTH54650.1 hypothetical protein [Metabacillus mangrovi]
MALTTSFIIILVLISTLKLVLASPPTFVVEWFIGKFEVHQKLTENPLSLRFNGKPLNEKDRVRFLQLFNESGYLDKYEFPPEQTGTPVVVETKKKKHDVKLYVYMYSGRMDVVKKFKKKEVVYTLLSDQLEEGYQVCTEHAG